MTSEADVGYMGAVYMVVVLLIGGALILSLAFFAVRSIILRRRLLTISELIDSMWNWRFVVWFLGVVLVLFAVSRYILWPALMSWVSDL